MSTPFPANPKDKDQFTDEFGSIWIYNEANKAWNVYGQFADNSIVTKNQNGLADPIIYSKIQTLRDIQKKGINFETIKLAGLKDAQYYYFKSSDKMVRFLPESSSKLRIEIDKSRIYQVLYKQACPGGPGPKGYTGDAGPAGSVGATELYYEPSISTNILNVSIITPTPLIDSGEIPLPNGHVPDISVRLYRFLSGTPDHVDQLVGFISHYTGAYGVDQIIALINQQFECISIGGTNCPYPNDLNQISILASGTVSDVLAEVLIDPTGKLPNRIGQLNTTELDISTTLASFVFDIQTNLVTGGFYNINGPWNTTKPYGVKSRQKGPDGSVGIGGNCTIFIDQVALNAGSANNPLVDLRWDSARNTIYYRTSAKNDISCASTYLFSPANATLVGPPEIKKVKLLSVEKTTSDCKNIGVFGFIPLSYEVQGLDLTSWEPPAGCTSQMAFQDSNFDWVTETDTGVCPGGLAWFSPTGLRSVRYPYGIVVNTYQDGSDCCQEEFFYSPNVQDAPCTQAPSNNNNPTTTTLAPTTTATTPLPTPAPTQTTPWTPPTTATTTSAPTTATTTTNPPTTGTTTTGTTATTNPPLPYPNWWNRNFDINNDDLNDNCLNCNGSIFGGYFIYGANFITKADADAVYPNRTDTYKMWTTWGTSGTLHFDPAYTGFGMPYVWSRKDNAWIDTQNVWVNNGQAAFYYHKNWAIINPDNPGNFYINTAGDSQGDLDIGGNVQILLGLGKAKNGPGNAAITASPYLGPIQINQPAPAGYPKGFTYSGMAYEITGFGFSWLNSPTSSSASGMLVASSNTIPAYDKQPFLKLNCLSDPAKVNNFNNYGGLLKFMAGNNRATGTPTSEIITPAELNILSAPGTMWQFSSYSNPTAYFNANGSPQNVNVYHYVAISKNAYASGKFVVPTKEPKYQSYISDDFIMVGMILEVSGKFIKHYYKTLRLDNAGIIANPAIFGSPYIFQRARGAANFPYLPQPASLCVPGGYNPEVCDSPYPDASTGVNNKYYSTYATAVAGWVPSGPLLSNANDPSKIHYQAGIEPYILSPIPKVNNIIKSPAPGYYNPYFAADPWIFNVPSSLLTGAKHNTNGKAGANISALTYTGAVALPISVLVRNNLSIGLIEFNDKYSKKYWNDPFEFYS